MIIFLPQMSDDEIVNHKEQETFDISNKDKHRKTINLYMIVICRFICLERRGKN